MGIVKRADGRWQESITLENGKRKYFYGKTKREVQIKMMEFNKEKEEESRVTFAKAADEYARSEFPSLSPNSLKNYRPALKRAKEHFGSKSVSAIRPMDINAFLHEFINNFKTGKKPGQKTVNTQLLVVSLVFKYCVAAGYVEFNPARDVVVPKGLPKNRRKIPLSDEIAIIKASKDEPFGLFPFFILYTGLRRGELQALRWEDISFTRHTITVSKSVYHEKNTPQIKPPKSDAGIRTVALPNKLSDALKEQYPDAESRRGIIFPGDSGGLMTNTEFQRYWRVYKRATGINCTPHQIRHAYASMLFENNIGIKDSQRLLGHAQASTTQDIYTHIRQEREDAINQSLLDIDF